MWRGRVHSARVSTLRPSRSLLHAYTQGHREREGRAGRVEEREERHYAVARNAVIPRDVIRPRRCGRSFIFRENGHDAIANFFASANQDKQDDGISYLRERRWIIQQRVYNSAIFTTNLYLIDKKSRVCTFAKRSPFYYSRIKILFSEFSSRVD